jgi:flagellar basal-body rod modification protein FlgD
MSIADTLPSTYFKSSAAGGTTAATSTTAGAAAAETAGSEDRFLKLLGAQMKNQDPLSPLDNAQVTSQMAQISTVNGVEKLNTTVAGLNAQFVQMQALQGASLVGHDVSVPGDRLKITSGTGEAAFELAATAGRVKVEVLSPAGQVVDTVEMGTLNAGTHEFQWAAKNVADGAAYRFRVTATQGTASVTATPLMNDKVDSVSTTGTGLQLHLENSGSVAYSAIRSFR